MTIGITVGAITDEIGAADFVHAFFSTISAHGEPEGWGTRFPHLMNMLYQGHLGPMHASAALSELEQARVLLDRLPASAVVWDIDSPRDLPPWRHQIAADITSLGNYFVSSSGRDLFDLLGEVLTEADRAGQDVFLG